MNIKELLGLAPVGIKSLKSAPLLLCPDPALFYGLELEIERTQDWQSWGITVTEDGSLRNNGREFITAPMPYSTLAYCLDKFFKLANVSKENYSDRCSIHVHTNCQDLEIEQVQSIIILYQVFERLLYEFVGNGRKDNIFCVPWHQTNLTYSILNNPEDIMRFKRWQKYTGLNLLPLFTQGTIEWRHMHGHGNVPLILLWCRLIGAIYRYARIKTLNEIKEEICSLNTNSLYQNILFNVFEEHTIEFLKIPQFEQLLELGVLDIKFALMKSSESISHSWLDNALDPRINRYRFAREAPLEYFEEGPVPRELDNEELDRLAEANEENEEEEEE
jgi:hypothetical protein